MKPWQLPTDCDAALFPEGLAGRIRALLLQALYWDAVR